MRIDQTAQYIRARAVRLSPTPRLSDCLEKLLGGNFGALNHVDLSPVLLELHFIHELVDQVNTATVIRVDVLSLDGTRQHFGIESGSGIPDYDDDASRLVAS